MKISNFLLYNTLRPYWESIRASYWFIPTLMIIGAFFLGYISTSWLPAATANEPLGDALIILLPNAARALASTVATSIITATSIAFSMTLVALTMASSQFGPRLLQTFMDDRGTQIVLGTLTSTFIYCLIVIYHLGSKDAQITSASTIGVSVLGIGFADTMVLIYYIHHIARFIQVDEIIERCYKDCLLRMTAYLPQHSDRETTKAIPKAMISPPHYSVAVKLGQAGYVQRIDYQNFLSQQREFVSGFHIHVKAGDYVTHTQDVFTVYSIYPLKKDVIDTLKKNLVLGKRRTAIQDPVFGLTQIVEISLRALSPGINDPMTAMTCADRLTTICLYLNKRTFPAEALVHQQSKQWMVRKTISFAEVLDTAFCQLRQAAAAHPDVLIHLLTCLKKCQEEGKQYSTLYNYHVDAVFESANFHRLSKYDQKALSDAYTAALSLGT